MYKKTFFGGLLAIGLISSSSAMAQEDLGINLDNQIFLGEASSYLAFGEDLDIKRTYTQDGFMTEKVNGVRRYPSEIYDKPDFGASDVHLYLGLATLVTSVAAVLTEPSTPDLQGGNALHYKLSKVSWQLGGATMVTGLYAHWDDFDMSDGMFDRDNMHVILGVASVIAMQWATDKATQDYNNNGVATQNYIKESAVGAGLALFAISTTW